MSLTPVDDRTNPNFVSVARTVWEYRVLDLRNIDLAAFETQLCDAGLDGWELVGTTHASQAAVLKRPSPSSGFFAHPA
jgi:hypothetical protein